MAYKYNADGIRVQKIDDPDGAATTTTYLIDAYNHTGYAQVLEESGANLKTYTIGDDILTQAIDDGVGRHLLYDGHGSTTFAGDRSLAGMAPMARNRRPEKIIGFLNLTPGSKCFSSEKVITAELNQVSILFAGVLREVAGSDEQKSSAEIERTPLLITTNIRLKSTNSEG